ncbi:Protein AE7 [Histomonas meleagridis]|uniref:Protein AE7 n=1 Tax=Histomonas meleagridis TaxID=135588 RepID=UPI003559E35D|nr:Protein AE7 [Histomonas meleagridis]KAH0800948.1 Protein AE7 [Histomonas meleagridis]
MSLNPNPVVYATSEYTRQTEDNLDSPEREPIDSLEVYEYIRFILDPEHPFTLEQLHIVSPDSIIVNDEAGFVDVTFTPTVPNCSLPAILGLCIREKLLRVLPLRFHSKIRITVAAGKHIQEESINRQLRDKERCLAALERKNLRDMIERCIDNNSVYE